MHIAALRVRNVPAACCGCARACLRGSLSPALSASDVSWGAKEVSVEQQWSSLAEYQGSAATAAFPPAPTPSSQSSSPGRPPRRLAGPSAVSPSSARVALKACAWRSGNMLSYAGWRVHFTPAAGWFARDYSGCVSSFLFVCPTFTGRF